MCSSKLSVALLKPLSDLGVGLWRAGIKLAGVPNHVIIKCRYFARHGRGPWELAYHMVVPVFVVDSLLAKAWAPGNSYHVALPMFACVGQQAPVLPV